MSWWSALTPFGTARQPGGKNLGAKYVLYLSGLLLLALACSQAGTQPAPAPAPSPTPEPSPAEQPTARASPTPTTTIDLGSLPVLTEPKGPPPEVDTSIASVPLEDVVFDTFRGGFIRLSEATNEQIEALRDRIKPIYEPKYDSVDGGDWLDDDDLVIGYVSQSGPTFAYPHKMLNLHEFVNDVIDGVPVLVSYCPLCASGVVFSRELDGGVLLFGNTSALYESDAVMYDHQTGSYWFQVIGEAIVGPLTGKRLTPLPSVTTTWAQWKELYPDTKILSQNLGLTDPLFYRRDPFKGYDESVNRERFVFPVSEEKLDDRLRAGDRVFAVQVGESHKAYLLTDRPDGVINDEVGDERIVVIVRTKGPTGSAYLSALDGQTLTFTLSQGVVQDSESGSRWDDAGRAISGPLVGAQLTPVASRASFWFSLVGSLPGIELNK